MLFRSAGANGRIEHDELRYNAAARRVMQETGVAIDDLHALVIPLQAKIQLSHNVHFTPDGNEQLADRVVARIRPLLPGAIK